MEKSKRGKDTDDRTQLDKIQVLQEARQRFTASSESPKKLIDTLTKCIFILLQGEQLDNNQASDLFLQITQLFQYKNSNLKRLIYIGIKLLAPQVENVFVVTSSLMNDITTSNDPTLRAAALRALCQISETSNLPVFERCLKQGVADKHAVVASAAITSLIRINDSNPEFVKSCTYEIQEALNADSPMVQYHALILLYSMYKNDKMATSRLISNCLNQGLKSTLAICLLIRIITRYINENNGEGTSKYKDYIRNQLSHRSDMVVYEGANALVDLKRFASESDRKSAVMHLDGFLTSSKAALRFGAVNALNKLAALAPKEVSVCNFKLEALISQSDCNRSIAILAITTLLETGEENTVETLLKKIQEFLSEIDEEFKVTVIKSVKQLCQKYPRQHKAMLDFLSDMLREEGSCQYKKSIVDTITDIIENNDEFKEHGLMQFCEFIEDCEHASLAVQVLCVLGREGPKTERPARYIRFIANRLLLDPPPVGPAAVSALAQFGVVPELRNDIVVLLNRNCLHEDYEVMERAVFYKGILECNNPKMDSMFITLVDWNYDIDDMVTKLTDYLSADSSEFTSDITFKTKVDEAKETQVEVEEKTGPPVNAFGTDLGDLIRTYPATALNADISEFTVRCTPHIYKKHIVFQFDITNTVDTMVLENISIEVSAPAEFSLTADTECSKLEYKETASVYTCFALEEEILYPDLQAEFTNINLKYNHNGAEDDYPLDDTIIVDLAEFYVEPTES